MRAMIEGPLAATAAGARAQAVLRACVHCGMCNATCPTYALTGDELDGPRGRIYLIKQMLEGEPAGALTQDHLDRCLSCRACETTCPSGVEYHRLLDVGLEAAAQRALRPWRQRAWRALIRWAFVDALRARMLGALARLAAPALPQGLGRAVSRLGRVGASGANAAAAAASTAASGERRMEMLAGCVQAGFAPAINAAAQRVLGRIGVTARQTPGAGCCGALAFHTGDHEGARRLARANVGVWSEALAAGARGVVVTASGCAAFIRDYGDLLADDPEMASKAATVARAVVDPADLLDQAPLTAVRAPREAAIALHTPCTARNRKGGAADPAGLLTRLGFTVTRDREPHMCCGSAGAWSLLHPAMARELRARKLAALGADKAQGVCTANIGCLMHLAGGTQTPVRHWLEAVDEVTG